MIKFPNLNRGGHLLHVMIILLISICISCSKDSQQDVDVKSISRSDDCELFISYDVERVTTVVPAADNTVTELHSADQIMLPDLVHCNVSTCVFPDGTVEGSIQALPMNQDYIYPEGVIGSPDKPTFHAARINNGSVTFYNENNEVIDDGILENMSGIQVEQLTSLENLQPISPENMTILIDKMVAKGYQVTRQEGSEHIFHLVHTLQDGSAAKATFDMEKLVLVGLESYDTAGKLVTRRRNIFEGTAGNVVPKSILFETFYVSPFSQAKMSIREHSRISNFSISF